MGDCVLSALIRSMYPTTIEMMSTEWNVTIRELVIVWKKKIILKKQNREAEVWGSEVTFPHPSLDR